jgi:hypothetical protein
MITVNQPFDSLEPLTTYLDTLQRVTELPTSDNIAELEVADMILTDRAVLDAKQELVHGEGYRTLGFEPRTISDGVTALARIALHTPGSQEYFAEYYRRLSRDPSALPRPDIATDEKRRDRSRVALISPGGKLAVSGAFIERDIGPAYEAARESIDAIGLHDESFLRFGLTHISEDLLEARSRLSRYGTQEVPISSKEARANINSAWNVVGHPGWLARISAFLP